MATELIAPELTKVEKQQDIIRQILPKIIDLFTDTDLEVQLEVSSDKTAIAVRLEGTMTDMHDGLMRLDCRDGHVTFHPSELRSIRMDEFTGRVDIAVEIP